MGRLFPFLILLSLVALAIYAGLQSYALIKKQPLFPKSTPGPTAQPQVTLFPTPTPHPGLNAYLEAHLLSTPTTCVHQYLSQDNKNYYLWAICKNSTISISLPVAVALDLSSHQSPRAGSDYEPDLTAIFPSSVLSHPIFSDSGILDSLQSQLP